MKFTIYEHFKVIVFPNEANKLVQVEKTFDYDQGEIITPESGLRFEVLKAIYEGNLLPDVEYQIFATSHIFQYKEQPEPKIELYTTTVIEISDFSELEGLNPATAAWVKVDE